jgi:hypothetical protein
MILVPAFLAILAITPEPDFVVNASAEITYMVDVSRDDLRSFVDDIGLFKRNMDGVQGVDSLGENTYLYRTSRDIPLKGRMEVDFVIRKTVADDTLTVYRTPDDNDPNWMECRVRLRPAGVSETLITVSLHLRLEREHGYEVHWLAPVVGADFIRERMEDDLKEMLKEFAENSSRELSRRFPKIARKTP